MGTLRYEIAAAGGFRGLLGGQVDAEDKDPLLSGNLTVTGAATASGAQPVVPAIVSDAVFVTLTALDAAMYVDLAAAPDPTTEPRRLLKSGQSLRLHVVSADRISAVLASDVPAVPGSSASAPVVVQETRQADASARSGTITAGGVAQDLMAANAARRGWEIQNQSTGRLWVRSKGSAGTTVATADQNSVLLEVGDYYSPPHVTANALSIIGPTTGQAFYAREW